MKHLILTGLEFRTYMSDDDWWFEERWFDDGEITVDGVDIDDVEEGPFGVPDKSTVMISGDVIIKADDAGEVLSTMIADIQKWRKARETATTIVTIHRDKLDELIAAVKELGGKISV